MVSLSSFLLTSKQPSSRLYSEIFFSADVSMLLLATNIPDINPIISIRKSAITRYFCHSPRSSLMTRFLRGFFNLLISFSFFDTFLPVKIYCRYFIFVDIVVSYHSVTKLYHMIGHMLYSLIMCNHDNCISILLINIFNQLEYFL